MPKFDCALELQVTDLAAVDSAWETYQAAFAQSGDRCVQEQLCYTKETLQDALADPDYLKFVLRDGMKVIGLCLATNNLEKARVTYVNPERLRRDYPQETAAGKLYYFTAICIRPAYQQGRLSLPLYQKIGEWTAREKPLIAFDFSIEKNSFLPKLLLDMSKVTVSPHVGHQVKPTYTKLGGQEYGVLRVL